MRPFEDLERLQIMNFAVSSAGLLAGWTRLTRKRKSSSRCRLGCSSSERSSVPPKSNSFCPCLSLCACASPCVSAESDASACDRPAPGARVERLGRGGWLHVRLERWDSVAGVPRPSLCSISPFTPPVFIEFRAAVGSGRAQGWEFGRGDGRYICLGLGAPNSWC